MYQTISRMHGLWLLLAASAASCLGQMAIANANIARIPASITQDYGDGDTSTLQCPMGFRHHKDPKCRLTVREAGSQVSFEFEPLDAGYSFINQQYSIFGRIKSDNFVFRIDVDCNDSDLKLAKGAAAPRCTLDYVLLHGKLAPDFATIRFEERGDYHEASRPITGSEK